MKIRVIYAGLINQFMKKLVDVLARFIQIVFVWIFWWVQAEIFVIDFRMFSELLEIDFCF